MKKILLFTVVLATVIVNNNSKNEDAVRLVSNNEVYGRSFTMVKSTLSSAYSEKYTSFGVTYKKERLLRILQMKIRKIKLISIIKIFVSRLRSEFL